MKGISNFKGLKVMFGALKKKKRKWFHLLVFIYKKKGGKGDHFDQCLFNSWTWYKINHSVMAVHL